ncbi:MAG: M23 family metallopeptidase [Candidatus Thiodiazotropha sp. (ex Myrtea sp. 'scaly one' KF741663)]|nr:M23 family metallopeptidase [Candidatus Thiodiazotropha sp. (ex Myrtea sp. 'scaly one' KF741663)]
MGRGGRRVVRYITTGFFLLLVAGYLVPENAIIPVQGASAQDWNHNTFWYEPWGTSGVHKGIDIFGNKGTPVVTATGGMVVYSGEIAKGGEVIAVLGPKWCIHYFAHLDSRSVSTGAWVTIGESIGTLGDSGNAAGKPPHVHYSVVSLIPYPWLVTGDTQGWKRMFYLNPADVLL